MVTPASLAFLVLVTFVSLATDGQPMAYGLPLYAPVWKVTSVTFEIAYELNRCVIELMEMKIQFLKNLFYFILVLIL